MPRILAALCRAGIFLALLSPIVASAKRPPPPPMTDTITSREVVEKQLASPPVYPTRLSGAEAKRIHDRYIASIGTMIETTRDEQSRNGQ